MHEDGNHWVLTTPSSKNKYFTHPQHFYVDSIYCENPKSKDIRDSSEPAGCFSVQLHPFFQWSKPTLCPSESNSLNGTEWPASRERCISQRQVRINTFDGCRGVKPSTRSDDIALNTFRHWGEPVTRLFSPVALTTWVLVSFILELLQAPERYVLSMPGFTNR